jgi:hypothetical protein
MHMCIWMCQCLCLRVNSKGLSAALRHLPVNRGGFSFLDIPRSYYGVLTPEDLTLAGCSEALSGEVRIKTVHLRGSACGKGKEHILRAFKFQVWIQCEPRVFWMCIVNP